MSTIICKHPYCPNRKGVFCGQDIVSINMHGQCLVFYDELGQPRAFPVPDRNQVEKYVAEVRSLSEEKDLALDTSKKQESPPSPKG